jgi:hypothetical protein
MPRIELETNVGRSLEQLVEANGLFAVLEALAEIAYGKAEQLEATGQDESLEQAWLAAGRKLAKTIDSYAVMRLAELTELETCPRCGVTAPVQQPCPSGCGAEETR